MARHSRALLPLLLLAGALVQGVYCSRPSPGEPQKPAVLPDPVVHGADEPARHRDGTTTQVRRPAAEEAAGAHRGADADGAPAASALDDGGAAGSSEQMNRGALVPQQVLGGIPAGSKLARRVLGGEVEDSAAGPSCRSNDVRVTCTPPPAPHITDRD